jgi:mannose-6-phosphate isomerase-like protein (cupin superfamily)
MNKTKGGKTKGDIEKMTLRNNKYRKFIYTDKNIQMVLMNIPPGAEIGREKHQLNTQFFRVESGQGKVQLDDKYHLVKDGDYIIVPANTYHNVINTGDKDLKLYTIYSPPVHKIN